MAECERCEGLSREVAELGIAVASTKELLERFERELLERFQQDYMARAKRLFVITQAAIDVINLIEGTPTGDQFTKGTLFLMREDIKEFHRELGDELDAYYRTNPAQVEE